MPRVVERCAARRYGNQGSFPVHVVLAKEEGSAEPSRKKTRLLVKHEVDWMGHAKLNGKRDRYGIIRTRRGKTHRVALVPFNDEWRLVLEKRV